MRTMLHSFAHVVPERVVTNHDLAKLMDTSDEWIQQRSGIKQRYWVTPPTTTSDLGARAAEVTLSTGRGMRSDSLAPDAIIAATLSPDYSFPGIGVLIQHKLGLPAIPAFDIRNQCSGFLYATQLASALVQAQAYRRILVVGAEVHSTGLDVSTRGRDIAVLFGDGAGSCLVEAVNDASSSEAPSALQGSLEFLGAELHSDGAFVRELWCEHPGSAHFPTRITPELVSEGRVYPLMNGRKVFEHAVRAMTEVSRSLLDAKGFSPKDVGLFVPHQANIRINSMVAAQLGLSESQVWSTIEQYGNTTAATIPIGISTAQQAGRLTSGDVVLSAAFGSGFTWGAALFRVR